jgi:outer membrane protein OmpA-like peptidoglycan-associated protein
MIGHATPAVRARYLPLVLLASIGWLGLSSWWYICKIQYLCDSKVATPAVVTPVVVKKEEPVVTKPEIKTFGKKVVITFGPDSSTIALNDAQNISLNEAVAFLKDNPTSKAVATGYVAVAAGGAFTDDELAKARATALKDYMVTKGIDASRITTDAKGAVAPVASNDSEEGQALNRRVELLINN